MNPSSTPEIIAFTVFGAMAVVSAIATVTLRNTIRSAMGLFFHVLSLAGLYMTLSAHFLVAVQLIVYVGAVVVLFVFVIMMLGPGVDTPSDTSGRLVRWSGGAAAVGLGALIFRVVGPLHPALTQRSDAFGTLREVGANLFGPAVIPFELASVLLTAAIVGAFAVARGHHDRVRMSTGPSVLGGSNVPAERPSVPPGSPADVALARDRAARGAEGTPGAHGGGPSAGGSHGEHG